MDVHIRDLRYFVTTAECLHFTRAAEQLFVSQPALSKQIRLLERQLRAPLFVRDRRSVHLTPAGTALLPQARAVLEAWEEGQRLLDAATQTQVATLVIGISTGLGRGLLPRIRDQLARSAPDAVLQVRQIPWDDSTGGLTAEASQRADAAFVWLPIAASQSLEWLTLATETRLVALPADHPLATRDAVDFDDLVDERFLALPEASGPLRDFWLATAERRGRRALIGAEISSTEEAVEALTARLGICLVASGNAALVSRDGIVVRPVSGLDPSRLVLAWRRGDDRPLLAALRQAVVSVVGVRDTG